VDGLILSGSEVKIDESAATGESDEIKKLPFDEISEEHKTGNNASIEGP
jgi:magnesium-transporting ATPase (P-type)